MDANRILSNYQEIKKCMVDATGEGPTDAGTTGAGDTIEVLVWPFL